MFLLEPSAPLITGGTAFLVVALFTLIYIAPFYLSPTLRSSPLNSRDCPAVIKARVRAVGLTCLACTVITAYILAFYGHADPRETLRLLGVFPVDLIDVVKVLGLVMVLFACSIYENVLVDGEWREWSLTAFKAALWDDWIGYRNLVVAPASEEIVFRSLSVPLFLLAKMDPTRIVFITPLIFGLAHLHHLVEFLTSRTPIGHRWPPLGIWISGILRSTFQFAYTSLFGFFAAFVFLRTGNLFACIIAHSFCNRMGVPRLWGRVGQVDLIEQGEATPGVAQGKRSDDDVQMPGSPVKVGNSLLQPDDGGKDEVRAARATLQQPKSKGLTWTVVYYALLLGGAYGFWHFLWPLTRSEKVLVAW